MNRTLPLPAADGLERSLPLAGPAARFAAWWVDWIASLALAVALGKLAGVLIVFGLDAVLAARVMSYFVCNVAYGIVSEFLLRGQSVGKRLFGLRVIDARGGKLELWQIVVRNLMRFIDMLPAAYALGGLSVSLSPRAQRLGDVVAGTAVVTVRPAALPATEHLAEGEPNSLWGDRLAVARLRGALDGEFALLGFEALLRRGELEPSARAALFSQLAAAVRQRVRLPASLTRGLSDERLVRNVVEVLFRADAAASYRNSPGSLSTK